MGGRYWTEDENERLIGMWHMVPLNEIAKLLGRTELGIKMQALRLGLRSIKNNPRFLTRIQLADALGVCPDTAYRMMCDGRLSDLIAMTPRTNTEIAVISLDNLARFVGDPRNWYVFDPDKVNHPELKRNVQNVRRWWHDEWWTVNQACAELAVCSSWLCTRLQSGLIRGRKYGYFWRVLKSDIVRVKKELHQPDGWLRFACDEANVIEFSEL